MLTGAHHNAPPGPQRVSTRGLAASSMSCNVGWVENAVMPGRRWATTNHTHKATTCWQTRAQHQPRDVSHTPNHTNALRGRQGHPRHSSQPRCNVPDHRTASHCSRRVLPRPPAPPAWPATATARRTVPGTPIGAACSAAGGLASPSRPAVSEWRAVSPGNAPTCRPSPAKHPPPDPS